MMANVKKEDRSYFFKPYERLLVGLCAFLIGGGTGAVIGVLVLSAVMLSNPITTGIWLGAAVAVAFTLIAAIGLYWVERHVRKAAETSSATTASAPSSERRSRQPRRDGRKPPRYDFSNRRTAGPMIHPSGTMQPTTAPNDLLRVAKEIVDETLYVEISKLSAEINTVAQSALADGAAISSEVALPAEVTKLKTEFEMGLTDLKDKFQNLMTESLKGPNSTDYQAAKSELEKYAKRQLPLLYHPDKHQKLKLYYECMFKTLYAFYEKNEQAVEMLQKGLKFSSDAQSLHEMRQRIFEAVQSILRVRITELQEDMRANHARLNKLEAMLEQIKRQREQTAPPTHLPSQPFTAIPAEQDAFAVGSNITASEESFVSNQNGRPT